MVYKRINKRDLKPIVDRLAELLDDDKVVLIEPLSANKELCEICADLDYLLKGV
jgi:hypothetical protein